MALNPQAVSIVSGAIERIMRQGTNGFIGQIDITNVRAMKHGYAAKVVATKGGIPVEYRARVGSGRGGIVVKRVTPMAEIERAARVMYG